MTVFSVAYPDGGCSALRLVTTMALMGKVISSWIGDGVFTV